MGKLNRYTPEYRDEAVSYWKQSGKSVAKCAADLGINVTTLSTWVTIFNKRQSLEGEPATFEQAAKFRQLQKDNSRLKQENEFLKKASAYFASMQK